ncbi:uncharacterized protein LOC126843896 [Adelges cooleyi]|uniref:uncharacterized protein LOC126843896 n=1 Tax=Adelges cooleyi TaxID=133065 RepID=UPI00217F5003|nr:uncharacterized protein LOC126843896 [Adelges cooleyi]
MLHSKLLLVIVSSLVVPVCRSALSEENVTKSLTLKCTCLMSGLTHVRLTMLAITNPSTPPNSLLSTIMWYNGREVISVLYNLDGVKIGSLWALHLYTALVRRYFDVESSTEDRSGRLYNLESNIFPIHSYVTELLWSDWHGTGCSKFDIDDRYRKWLERKPDADLSEITEMVRDNNHELHLVLDEKIDSMSADEHLTTLALAESLKMKNLFLNDLGNNHDTRRELMSSYDVRVNWTGADRILTEVWVNLSVIAWTENNFQNIKSYYTACFDFFKIIYFHLIWKDLLCIKALKRHSSKYINYVQKCHELLTEFGEMLRIEDDTDIQKLATSIDMVAKRKKAIDYAIDVLNEILNSSAMSLMCNATDWMTITHAEVRREWRAVLLAKDEFPELGTQETAKAFMNRLTTLCRGVDFGIIRSLIVFIDEINQELNKSQ